MRREWVRYMAEWPEEDYWDEYYPSTEKEPVVDAEELNDLVDDSDDIIFTPEGGFSGDMESLEKTWSNFRRRRPVTAHMLEQLFGDRAIFYFYQVSKEFTERQAVSMVSYVYNNPKKILSKRKNNRIQLILDMHSEEE